MINIKDGFWKEWERLNPRFVTASDGIGETLWHAFHESLRGFFAPLRMASWLLKTALKKVI